MFGHIKPYRPELKLREMTEYRAAYCGLCRALGKRYGAMARLLVNYDFVLTVLLFWPGEYCLEKKRCVKHPFRGCRHLCESDALSYAADALMLFTYWKLRDAVHDSRFAPAARLTAFIYRRGFRRAAERLPEESAGCARGMDELKAAESAGSDSSGAFAGMLSGLSLFYRDGGDRQAARSLFYHLGRWIVFADAVEDHERDLKKRAYNAAEAAGLSREEVFALMGREQESVLAAFELLEENGFSAITRNILSLGLHERGHYLYTGKRKGRRC
jgi:hypothetical protein